MREGERPVVDGDQTEQPKQAALPDDAGPPQSDIGAADAEIRAVPNFLRQATTSGDQAPGREASGLSSVRSSIAMTRRRILAPWRRHLVQDASDIKTERMAGRGGNVAFAFLSAVTIVTCVGAAIALAQIKFLKSEIDRLRRELLPLSERLAKLEQVEKTPALEINRPSVSQTKLELSPEEIQSIRDYIKPAPYSGPAGPAINVGDPVTATMIPLPSPLTDKIPKLLGARFAIQNGAIIIVRPNSRNAEIVLAP
jgi:hypothetical protein